MISVHVREGSAFLINILERWRSWRRTRNGLAELHQLGLELLARDVNLLPWDLRAVAAKWPDGSDLLLHRLTTLQLNPEQFSSAQSGSLRHLERVCTLCGSKSRCEHDLARNASTTDWRGYCPNVATLDALQSESTSRKSVRQGAMPNVLERLSQAAEFESRAARATNWQLKATFKDLARFHRQVAKYLEQNPEQSEPKQ